MRRWNDWIPCTKVIGIGNGIKYRLHKHWGMNIWAGEGLFIHNGDRSGCLTDYDIVGRPINKKYPLSTATCAKPLVVLQRIYYKGKKQISAVLSYPNGLSLIDKYFWEIYPSQNGDIERFFDETKMEAKIKRLLSPYEKGGDTR